MKLLPEDADFGMARTGLSQHARLITLSSAQTRDFPASLVPEHFTGFEAVNALFRFDIDALSTSTDLDLSEFIGTELTLALLQPDGQRRAWHGLCTHAAWLEADGGLARYRLRLEPALALLARRRDSYIFQDKRVPDILAELLADYPQVRVEFALTQACEERPICTQYRESDLDFFTRLLVSEGLNWRFEHDQPDAAAGAEHHALHRLVIFDRRARLAETPQGATLRFHGVRASDSDDAIDAFSAQRSVSANSVGISSWDPAKLAAPAAQLASHLDHGDVPQLAIYDGSGERIASAYTLAEQHSELMLMALEQTYKVFHGAGTGRRMGAGQRFRLSQHERYPQHENGFTVLSVNHTARNNLRSGLANTAHAALDDAIYRNTFSCVRDTVALVPAQIAIPQRPTAPGPQTALVVGLANAVATTTRDHQVKTQFPWQRGKAPNPGGLRHNTDEAGSARGDDTSGTWVRVAEALAGPPWGSVFTPRIGSEVLVDFIEGDIDRPLIVAQLYTGADPPPFAAGVGSATNHVGALSGMHTHNLDQCGFNQWQIADTAGQLRMRLATSSAATQLNLGYLIDQAPGSSQRGRYRGSGFELRTDAWSVIRGGAGVLLSTHARPRQGSGVSSTQMDAAQALTLMQGAQALADTLSAAASQQHAVCSQAARQAQQDFITRIDAQALGRHEDAVNGQRAFKPKAGMRELDPALPVEKFAAPIVLMDGAASINWATPASTVIYAGQHLHWTAQSDLHLTAAHTLSSVSGKTNSLFAHAGGIQAIAAHGAVSLQAHTDALEIFADAAITVISVNDGIELKAKEKIVLQAGQSALTLEGGNITFACPGKFTVKGGQHLFDQAARQSANLLNLPGELSAAARHWIALHYLDPDTAQGIPAADYEIHFEGGTVLSGTLDDNGKARHENVAHKPVRKIVYKPRQPIKEDPHDPLATLTS